MFLSVTSEYILRICMSQSSVITVKVPEQMKKKMQQVNVNWSEYIRECVQRKIDEQKKKAAAVKLDEIRNRAKPVSEEELLAWIREGRER